MEQYDPHTIETKWGKVFKEKAHSAIDFDKKPKHFHLVEFPYSSGEGLHVGHCMGYGASDAFSRMKRMQGFNVMFPIGWDAFGLPTENYAIKNKVKPQDATAKNIANFKKQMEALAYSFDWGREINTTDPDYYKWTQWIFLQFYNHALIDPSTSSTSSPQAGSGQDGKLVEVADDDTKMPRLAYQSEIPINWCPSCKIGLANEEVIGGKCERCETQTTKKMQKQWMLRITAYADRLIKDLDTVNYLPRIKTQQINWIGKSKGTNIIFKIKGSDELIDVFTTRADTLFGVTYVVLAPEHESIQSFKSKISNFREVEEYIASTKKKSDLERTELAKDKSGVELKGIRAVNPINGEEVSVWIADYVLANYGTGAVMAVPAHDQRDFEFASKHGIEIKEVVIPKVIDQHDPPKDGAETVFRNAIQAILLNPKDKKVLMLKWKKFPWTTFITGGVENGEDPIVAATREIKEETGYQDIKYIRTLDGPVESHFYANHKGVNRKAHFIAMVFELKSEDKKEISEEEQAIHELNWMTWDEIADDINVKCSEYDIWKDRFFNSKKSFEDYGVLINSNGFEGLDSKEAIIKITEKLKKIGAGDFAVNYKLRDWVFSRQHYWGEPIPIIHCQKCGIVPVSEDQLPVTLPEVENYEPTDTGESPLAKISDWVNTKCPKCGGNAKRETDTMPNWAGSSWYYLAYAMNSNNRMQKTDNNENIFAKNKEELKYWMPVDLYNGGMEHTNLHLLYSRFWHKFLFDLGQVPGPEPYQKRIAHGIILGTDGRKMSKSYGNVINPDDMIKKFGADTVRAYIMFIGHYDQESAWSTAGIQGVLRFLNRVYKNFGKITDNDSDNLELKVKLNQSIAGVSDDLENFRMNTVVSKLMELNNTIEKFGISEDNFKIFVKLLSPVAPFLSQELWEKLGEQSLVEDESWPAADKNFLVSEEIEIPIQINSKIRDRLLVPPGLDNKTLEEKALSSEKAKSNISGREVIRVIVIPDRLVSIVIRE